jgi:type I restriction enzyme S subunit
MIADLKPYAEYKESGLPWLGQVPGHWGIRRLKSHLLRNDAGVWGTAFDEQGTAVLRSTEQSVDGAWRIVHPARLLLSESQKNSALLDVGDLVVTKSSGSALHIGKTSLVTPRVAEMKCCFSNFMQRLRVSNNVSPIFAWILLNSRVAREQFVYQTTTTTGLGNLTGTILGNCTFSFPPLDEQAAIVRFLDWANGRLDRAIRAKRKVITLLNEQKQAIIHRAVTRGLDPSVPLKPSGIPWLGDIPQHWGIVRNMALFAHRVEAGVAGLPVFQVSLRSGITAEDLDQFGRPKKLITDTTKYKRIYRGDIAYNTIRMWQGAVGVSPSDGLVSPAYVVLSPRGGTCPDFYDFIFHTDIYKQQVNRQSTGIVSDRNRLYWDSFKQMPSVALPSSEQEAIVAFIYSQTSGLNAARARLEREIDLLREYRTRIVADVVTGKLDVREAAAQLPEEAAPDTSTELAGEMLDDAGNLDEVEAEET